MSKFKKFLFFLSSLIPGAGHMFLGFMKRGLLLMTIYFIDIGLSMILNGFLVFMPVIWFYCLFDAWNKFFLSDEEKRRVDDSFIFFYNAIPEELLPKSKRFSNKTVVFLDFHMFQDSLVRFHDGYAFRNIVVQDDLVGAHDREGSAFRIEGELACACNPFRDNDLSWHAGGQRHQR